MKKIFVILLFLSSVFKYNFSISQTIHFTDDFNNGCASGCLANGYNGWTVTAPGGNGAESNQWFVSCAENGNPTGTCGTGCAGAGDGTLHIGSTFPLSDLGASYFAGGIGNCLTDKRAESPTIDLGCSGDPVGMTFKYMENGQGAIDNFKVDYYDGSTWITILDPIKTPLGCAPQGTWTFITIPLPNSAVHNPNVKIGFHWNNNNDAIGTDPSVAIDSLTIYSWPATFYCDFTISNAAPCEGSCIDFTDGSFGMINSWFWDFGGGAVPNTSTQQSPSGICFNTAGSYLVTLTISDTCGNVNSNSYFVNVTPCGGVIVALFVATNTVLCNGDFTDFIDQSQGFPNFWLWDFPGGFPASSGSQFPPSVQYNTPGFYDVTLIVGDTNTGEYDTLTLVNYIEVQPCTPISANFTTPLQTFCIGTCIDFTDLTTGNPAISWAWTFAGGTPATSTSQNPTGICYNTPGVYDVSLLVSDGVNQSALNLPGYITVNPCGVINADFTTPNTVICETTCIDFTDLSVSTNGPITTWTWSFPGGTPAVSGAQNPTGICYGTAGVYDVTLTVDDGFATSTITFPGYITVNSCAPLNADFNTPLTNICGGTCINFSDLSIGTPISWTWTFTGAVPASSFVQNPTNICYATPGVYDVTLTVDDGTNTSTLNMPGYITVTNCAPTAAFTTGIQNICVGQCISFTDQSIGATAWTWGFLGATPLTSNLQNPTNICYNTAGVYDVALYVANANGFDTLIMPGYITVTNCPPVANFSTINTVGCNGDCLTFTNTSNGATTWQWSFPGGNPNSFSGQIPPQICYMIPGVYDVTLIVSNAGGTDTLVQQSYITINYCGGLLAGFAASDTVICEGYCISFIDMSFGAPIGWLWVMPGGVPDSSTAQNPPYVCYPSAGDYPVTLYAFNTGGIDSLTKTGYIHVDAGTPVVTNIDSTTIFAGTTVQLDASGGVSYQWYPAATLTNEFISSPVASPVDTTDYQVIMTDANGCTSTANILINVIPPETVWAPTAFTPNNDKNNDVFFLHPTGIINNYELKIFDRWGEMLFHSTDPTEGWDGTFMNTRLNVGVYVYYYKVEFIDGAVIQNSGDVTLIR